jgi:high-affinity Fe2+/Pb2+ permease
MNQGRTVCFTENAVKTQIWIAVSVYVLVAIMRKRLRLEASLHQILQILSLTLFKKTFHFMCPLGHRRGRQFRLKHQPTDSLRLLTGQQ